uniref:Chemosensory protein 1 n=1 Tax=Mythimna separata TaxID=271217 RepID=A0A1V1WCA1_MYTSE
MLKLYISHHLLLNLFELLLVLGGELPLRVVLGSQLVPVRVLVVDQVPDHAPRSTLLSLSTFAAFVLEGFLDVLFELLAIGRALALVEDALDVGHQQAPVAEDLVQVYAVVPIGVLSLFGTRESHHGHGQD